MKHKILLLKIDGLINIILGILLLLFPFGVAKFLGVPVPDSNFYATILGGVLFGIGIALFIENDRVHGLGLEGAIAINFSGATVLLIWLLFCDLQIPLTGQITLWTIVVSVYLIGFFEIKYKISNK